MEANLLLVVALMTLQTLMAFWDMMLRNTPSIRHFRFENKSPLSIITNSDINEMPSPTSLSIDAVADYVIMTQFSSWSLNSWPSNNI
jgi:hypothetical protein